jgi:hypothetical protein
MLKSSSLCLYSSNLGTFWLKMKQFWPFEEIYIFSNGGHLGWRAGQNCFILSQNVPKFELYKHNDELFSIYNGIFYELWTFADFDRLCKLGINKQKNDIYVWSFSDPFFMTIILESFWYGEIRSPMIRKYQKNCPRTIRATVPQLIFIYILLYLLTY